MSAVQVRDYQALSTQELACKCNSREQVLIQPLRPNSAVDRAEAASQASWRRLLVWIPAAICGEARLQNINGVLKRRSIFAMAAPLLAVLLAPQQVRLL
jgi:hypothetical protein